MSNDLRSEIATAKRMLAATDDRTYRRNLRVLIKNLEAQVARS